MPTPAELRRKAAELRARAQELLELADRMDADQARAEALTGGAGDLTMVPMDTTTETKIRRGVPLTSDGPYAIAARNSNHSLLELAPILGLTYSTIKMRNSRRSAPEADRKALSKRPYLVPATAWKK